MLLGRGTADTGSLVYKVENRHALNTDLAPQDLGFASGYVSLTASPYSQTNWSLTNPYWSQKLLDGG